MSSPKGDIWTERERQREGRRCERHRENQVKAESGVMPLPAKERRSCRRTSRASGGPGAGSLPHSPEGTGLGGTAAFQPPEHRDNTFLLFSGPRCAVSVTAAPGDTASTPSYLVQPRAECYSVSAKRGRRQSEEQPDPAAPLTAVSTGALVCSRYRAACLLVIHELFPSFLMHLLIGILL